MTKKSYLLSDKSEYIAVDIFKLICSILVVAIHTTPFRDMNEDLSFWFNNVVCRIAVPFFFISAGYFFHDKLTSKEKTLGYISRLVQLYMIYTMFHFEFIFKKYYKSGQRIRQWFVDFFWTGATSGTYVQLWYLPALVFAIVILYFLINKFKVKTKTMVIAAAVLYVIGTLGNAYTKLLYQIPGLEGFLDMYYELFKTTGNGLFFGFPLVLAGYLIKEHSDKIPSKPYLLLALLTFGLMSLESIGCRILTDYAGSSMLFLTPVVTILLFIGVALIRIPAKFTEIGKICRNMSFLIYAWHLFVVEYVRLIVYGVDTWKFFCSSLMVTLVWTGVLVFLSRFKFFSWIKFLY